MKKFLQITMSNGHVYEVPTSVIADNRATAMAALHPGEFATLSDAKEDTTALFDDDSFQIEDWAKNQMNWSEIVPHAKLIRALPRSSGWPNVEVTYHDHQALLGELDGDVIMSQPVELIMHTMATSGQLCNVTVLNGQDGKPYAAMALMFGNEAVINSYLTGLQFVGQQLTMGAQAALAEQADATAH